MDWQEIGTGAAAFVLGVLSRIGARRALPGESAEKDEIMTALASIESRLGAIEAKQDAQEAREAERSEQAQEIRRDLHSAMDRLVNYVLDTQKSEDV